MLHSCSVFAPHYSEVSMSAEPQALLNYQSTTPPLAVGGWVI